MTELKSPKSALNIAADELAGYFLEPPLLSPTQTAQQNVQETDENLRNLIFGSPAGAFRGAQMVENLKGAQENPTTNFPIMIFSGKDESFNIPDKYGSDKSMKIDLDGTAMAGLDAVIGETLPTGTTPSDDGAHLSVICCMAHKLGPSMRNVKAIELFFNSLPTVQLALCQPYLTVNISNDKNPTPGTNRATGTSLYKFLEGAKDLSTEDSTIKMMAGEGVKASGTPGNIREIPGLLESIMSGEGPILGSAGMEIFTSPQLLVPAADHTTYNPELRAAPIIDRFRPFLSLNDFQVKTTGAGFGTISYRTATMSLTLHDRSRMGEISQLLNPGQYKSAKFFIEWGWSHPHGNLVDTSLGAGDGSPNVYGRFLNSLRKRETYRVTNYKLSFDDVGQVKIILQLHSSAAMDMTNIKIPAGPGITGVGGAYQNLMDITETIQEALGTLSSQPGGSESLANVKGNRFLGSMQSITTIPNLQTPVGDSGTPLSTQLRQLRAQLIVLKSDSDASSQARTAAKDLIAAINEVYTKSSNPRDGTTMVDMMYGDIESSVNRKLALIDSVNTRNDDLSIARSPDPFFDISAKWAEAVESGLSAVDPPTQKKSVVTFGKLMAIFLGVPLMTGESYSDVQLIFHKFNDQAGAAGISNRGPSRNISEFTININQFKSVFTSFVQRRRTVDLTVQDFVQFVVSNFVDDMSNEMYGVESFYQSTIDETGEYKVERRDDDIEASALGDARGTKLEAIGASPEFKMPQVGVNIEQMSGDSGTENDDLVLNEIVKIHFFDKQSTPHGAYMNTLTAAYEHFTKGYVQQPGEIADPVPEEPSTEEEGDAGTDTAEEGGGLGAQATDINTSLMLRVIRANVPTITYGTSASVIKRAQLSTMNDQALSTNIMTGGGPNPSPLTPQGMGDGNVPMMIFPTQLSMTIIGCPIIEYMQQFFIDFGTGTSVDNIYHAINVTHKIGPGNFETNLGFAFVDAYGTFRSYVAELKETESSDQS